MYTNSTIFLNSSHFFYFFPFSHLDLNLSDNQLSANIGQGALPISGSRSMPGSRRNSGRSIDVGPLAQQSHSGNISSSNLDSANYSDDNRRGSIIHQVPNQRALEQNNDQNLAVRTSSLRTRHGSIMDLDSSATTGGYLGGGGINNSSAVSLGVDQGQFRNQRRASSSTLIQYNNYVT